MEFFTYENIKELLVYMAFGMISGLVLYGYAQLIMLGVKWVIGKLKHHSEKGADNE